ncbi:MAG: hypothetical protein DRP09_16705 [Candidatus Thorarchaeota archaeon]|nr:MAG: hypothetical protein DRP09_16705 [Candidatus Thorarchaeota archaeon]
MWPFFKKMIIDAQEAVKSNSIDGCDFLDNLPQVLHTEGRTIPDGTPYTVRYFGVTSIHPESGILLIGDIIRDLNRKYRILGQLGKITQLETDTAVVTLVYFAFSNEDLEMVDKEQYEFKEGELIRGAKDD